MDAKKTESAVKHDQLALPAPAHPTKELPAASPETAGRRPARAPRKLWPWLLLLVLLAGGGYYYWTKRTPAGAPDATAGKGGGRRGGGTPPIVAVKARKGDIGVYYSGLGTVTPLNTVTVKSRVDGQLMNVNFKEGDTVIEGQTLAELDPRPFQAQLTQFEGQLARDQASLENAKIDLTRYQTLIAQNAIAGQQVDTQRALVKQFEGTVKTDEGLVEGVKLNITYTHITSPITGRIGLRLVDPGNIVHASDQTGMCVITQMQPISVIFTIAEDQLQVVLGKLRTHQRLLVDAWDREMKIHLSQGSLTTVDNQIDQTTGTLKLRATFDNRNSTMFPNQFVNARLLVEEKRGITLLTSAAVQRNSQMTYVYLVKPDSTATVREINVGVNEGDDTEITSGLVPGDVVAMTGVDKLTDGEKVNVHFEGETGRGAGGRGGANPGGGAGKGGGQGGANKGGMNKGAANPAAGGRNGKGPPAK
jgi:multidrug efflux system membrane fusion protein